VIGQRSQLYIVAQDRTKIRRALEEFGEKVDSGIGLDQSDSGQRFEIE